MNNQILHMIGNAHIDPVWLWQWPEGFHEVRATFRSALDRMNEYDDFIFVSSSAAYYEWIEKNDPGMFAEIRQRVAEGRWNVVGGWWIQPDCNLPGGESFVRQALYGQRYFKEKLGVTATVGYNVDSFGHHAMLPQLLKKSGLNFYVFMRPSPHEKGLPGRAFWWEADDGSRVLAYRIPYEYCSWGKDLDDHIRRCAAEIKPPVDESMCFYGVGNHGGGPTRENIESIRRLQEDLQAPRLIFSTPQAYFDRLLAGGQPLPVVHDDLQHHASGCYSAHSGVKRWNRRAENLLLAAEKFSAIASWTAGLPYPDDFQRAWKHVLFNQFHDILAGTSIEEAYEDARDQYGEAISIANRALQSAVQALSWKIHIPVEERTRPVVVFHPHAWHIQTGVEMESGALQEPCLLLDDSGRSIPFQTIRSQATVNGRTRLAFIADLPPLGYRTYRLVPASQHPDIKNESQDSILAGDLFMENQRFRLELDPQTGAIRSLYDQQEQLEVLAGPAALPVVLEDDSDTWSHNVFQYNRQAGCFGPQSIRLAENGPVKATIRVVSTYGASQLVQDITMYTHLEQIDVKVALDWREQCKALKLRFPLNLSHMHWTSEIPYGSIERFANGQEEPGQSWVDLSGISRENGKPYGLSLLNDGKYSFDVNVRDIGLTVLRSPIYAHHMPVVPGPQGGYTFIDQGFQRFQYTLLPHTGSWERAAVFQRAAELNQPPVTVAETYHPDGNLPLSASFLSVDRENVVLSVLKKAEDGDDLILRGVEMCKEAAHARICLVPWERAFEADFGPSEIKTFRIPRDHRQPVSEIDLLEWAEAGS